MNIVWKGALGPCGVSGGISYLQGQALASRLSDFAWGSILGAIIDLSEGSAELLLFWSWLTV